MCAGVLTPRSCVAYGVGVGPSVQSWSKREIALRSGQSPSPVRLPVAQVRTLRSMGLALTTERSALCGRKYTVSLSQIHILLLLGPQFPHARTRGVSKLLVMHVGGLVCGHR